MGLAWLAVAAGAVVLQGYSFANAISAALTGSGDGADGFVALFLLALALGVSALVVAIVRLARGRSRVLSAVTILIALVPLAVLIWLRLPA